MDSVVVAKICKDGYDEFDEFSDEELITTVMDDNTEALNFLFDFQNSASILRHPSISTDLTDYLVGDVVSIPDLTHEQLLGMHSQDYEIVSNEYKVVETGTRLMLENVQHGPMQVRLLNSQVKLQERVIVHTDDEETKPGSPLTSLFSKFKSNNSAATDSAGKRTMRKTKSDLLWQTLPRKTSLHNMSFHNLLGAVSPRNRKTSKPSIPTVDTASIPTVDTASIPTVDTASIPTVDTASIPTVDTASIPTVDNPNFPSMHTTNLPSMHTTSLPSVDTTLNNDNTSNNRTPPRSPFSGSIPTTLTIDEEKAFDEDSDEENKSNQDGGWTKDKTTEMTTPPMHSSHSQPSSPTGRQQSPSRRPRSLSKTLSSFRLFSKLNL